MQELNETDKVIKQQSQVSHNLHGTVFWIHLLDKVKDVEAAVGHLLIRPSDPIWYSHNFVKCLEKDKFHKRFKLYEQKLIDGHYFFLILLLPYLNTYYMLTTSHFGII